jgi:hypothetical protein
LEEKLDEMTLHDETSDPRDQGYMAAVRELRTWAAGHHSKAHPASRHRGIGFKIGDAFPADDLIARWGTVLAMAANNAVYLNVRMIEGDLPPELSIYYFRLIAAHFFEAATWLKKTRHADEIDELITSLDDESRSRYDNIVAFASQKHPLYVRLRRSRATLFHYPTMHPAKDKAGTEELANAMREARDLDGWIEGGHDYASFRAVFADEIALQFLAENKEAMSEIAAELSAAVFELVEFAESALLVQLKRTSKHKTRLWRKDEPRPEPRCI